MTGTGTCMCTHLEHALGEVGRVRRPRPHRCCSKQRARLDALARGHQRHVRAAEAARREVPCVLHVSAARAVRHHTGRAQQSTHARRRA
jgi:hypothetical protein